MDDEVLGKQIKKRSYRNFPVIVVCFWNISGYDLRICDCSSGLLFIAGVRWSYGNSREKDYIEWDFCVFSAVVYYAIYLLVGCFVGTAGYLTDNYSGWSSENPLLEVVKSIANVARISFAIPYKERYIYGGGVICFVTAAFVIYSIWRFLKRKM